MPVFVDSGILLRVVHRADPLYADVRGAVRMLTHSLTELLTLNKADFIRYQADGLAAVTPAELLASVR